MMIGVSRRSVFRLVTWSLVAILALEFSPLPAMAASQQPAPASERGPLDTVKAQIRKDLSLLQSQGKEAYLDELFERLDQDAQRVKDFVQEAIRRIGARRLAMLIVGLASPVLGAVLAVVPEPWQAAALTAALNGFINKAIKQIKEALVPMSPSLLKLGLTKLLALLGNKNVLAGEALKASSTDGELTWWEKFFGNSTIVKNFIVTIVAVGSIGVAIGLAIAGSTAAPIVAVVGALVSLIALLNPSGGQFAPEPVTP